MPAQRWEATLAAAGRAASPFAAGEEGSLLPALVHSDIQLDAAPLLKSGFGRGGGRVGPDEFLQVKNVFVDLGA